MSPLSLAATDDSPYENVVYERPYPKGKVTSRPFASYQR